MTIEPTNDMELVKKIITNYYVWQYAADDGIEKDEFVPKAGPHNLWLLAYKDDLCGIILLEVESCASIKIHPYMLEEYKGQWMYMMREFFRWYLDNAKEPQHKVNAKTPVYNQLIRNLALNLGFKDEGVDRESFIKDGVFHDQYIFGITKEEMKEVVKWPQQSQ